MLPWTILTVLGVAGVLAGDLAGARWPNWVCKPLASAGFLGLALFAGQASTYGRAVLCALALCALGDVLLIPRGSKAWFRAGALAFLAGHLAYGAAFLLAGSEPGLAATAATGLAVPGALVLWWIWPRVPQGLRRVVVAYVVVISAMLALAAGTVPALGAAVAGPAALFYLSDVAVARERFVKRSSWNRAWGLPLYYAAQLLLAASTR